MESRTNALSDNINRWHVCGRSSLPPDRGGNVVECISPTSVMNDMPRKPINIDETPECVHSNIPFAMQKVEGTDISSHTKKVAAGVTVDTCPKYTRRRNGRR